MDVRSGIAAWLVNNQPQISRGVRRYLPVVQLLVGVFLAFLGYAIGKDHLRLVRTGIRASGTVVNYQAQTFWHSSNDTQTGYMPIVQFHDGNRLVQFRDWLGSRSPGVLGKPVTVLYDPANPSSAMIDRPVWNWIPWAPTLALGVFLILVGFRSVGVRATAGSLNPTRTGN